MTILINGVTSSIGQSLLKLIGEQKEHVIGTGRNAKLLQELKNNNDNLDIIETPDLLDIENIKRILQEEHLNSSINGFVHCSGKLNRYKDLSSISIEDWEDTMRVNLTSVFLWNKLMINYFI